MWGAIITAVAEYIVPFFMGLPSFVQTLIILGILWGIKAGIFSRLPFTKKKNDIETHQTCKLYPQHLEEIAGAKGKIERIMEEKYLNVIYNQMCAVETVSGRINDLLTDNYDQLLQTIEASEKKKAEAQQTYKLIIDWALDDARGYMRRYIKKNGFTSYDDVGFQTYIHTRSEELQKIIKKAIDRRYLKSQLLFDRKDVYESNMKLFYEKISVMISDLFVEVRAMAEQSEKKIKAIEEE